MIFQSGLDIQNANWVEPFFGTGVVGFNSPVGGNRIVGDTNPHIINFYNEIMNGEIIPQNMRTYLEREGQLLLTAEDSGYAYYREVKIVLIRNTAHLILFFCHVQASMV